MAKLRAWKSLSVLMVLMLIASVGAVVVPASPVEAAVAPMVEAGDYHTVGLKRDGTVVAVGNNNYGQCNAGSWTGITQVAAGGYHTVGLKSDGTVVAVGYNNYGQCGVDSWTGITQVAAGYFHTVGLKPDGTAVAVGYNSYGQCNLFDWNLGETPLPTVTTQAATGIGTSSATLNMSYTVGGYSPVDVRFAYKKTADTTWTETSWVSKTADGTHAEVLSALTPDTQYDFKAQLKYGPEAGMVIEGATLQFTTGKTNPTVTTQAATAIGTASATLNMSYTVGGYSPVDVRFAYKKAADTTWTETSWVSKTADGTHAEPLSGLGSNTTYDFKAQLKYGPEAGTVIEGLTLQFTTGKTPPPPAPTPEPAVSGISTAPPQSHGAGGMSSVTPPQGPMPLPNLLVQSAAITTGKQVSAKVANTGGASGSLRVTLYAGNNAVESKNVSLAPGDIATVSFDASSLGPGTYNIKVNNAPAGQLTVEGSSSTIFFFIALAAFLVLMATLFIIYFHRRRAAGW